jgi:hypothetical protein
VAAIGARVRSSRVVPVAVAISLRRVLRYPRIPVAIGVSVLAWIPWNRAAIVLIIIIAIIVIIAAVSSVVAVDDAGIALPASNSFGFTTTGGRGLMARRPAVIPDAALSRRRQMTWRNVPLGISVAVAVAIPCAPLTGRRSDHRENEEQSNCNAAHDASLLFNARRVPGVWPQKTRKGRAIALKRSQPV